MSRLLKPWMLPVVMGAGGSRDINMTCPAITPSLGAELLQNNTLETDTVWNKGTGWTIDTDAKVAVAAETTSLLYQGVAIAGNWYRIDWELVTITAGEIAGRPGINGYFRTAPGSYSDTGRASSNHTGAAGSGSGASGTVDNVYCKQITFASMLELLGDINRKNGTYTCAPTVAVSTQCGIVIEYADANNFVLAYVNRSDGKAYLDKRIGGTWTNVINGAAVYGDGKELKVVVSGNDHSLYYDDTQVGSTTAINDAGLGTKVYGFNTLAGNEVGLVTTNP